MIQIKYTIKQLLKVMSVVALGILTSCNEDVDVWDSETLAYSGTFFWELYNEDMSAKILSYSHDSQIMIYNTAENVENKIWIEDTHHDIPLKSKFNLSGEATAFASTNTSYETIENFNVLAVELPVTSGSGQEDDINGVAVEEPTAADEEVIIERYYLKSAVLEGKILEDAATTTSGNPVDSLYIKVKLMSGHVKFTSYEVPEELRSNPEEEEYAWEYDSATYEPSSIPDETYVISGHRKTGFAEDDH